MTNKILFTESQKFNLRMEWLILPILNLGLLYIIFEQALLKHNDTTPLPNTTLIFFGIISFVFSCSYLTSRVDLEIKEEGVYFRFYPFRIKFNRHLWEDLVEAQVRDYDSREFGGRGYGRRVYSKNGALIISGNKGLQLETKSGRKILIGTQKPQELEALLEQLLSKPNQF